MRRLTREQVRRIDHLSVEKYKIPGVVLMENAARGAADIAAGMLHNDFDGPILILCGGGNNGGDGLAIARHLHNRGAEISILLTIDPQQYTKEAKVNWEIIQAMGLDVSPLKPDELQTRRPRLIIDAIFGTGLTQAPRDPFAVIVAAIEKIPAPVLAIDIPSGLDCDTGKPLGACIKATQTVTFVAEKVGFAEAEARKYLGKVMVVDIGCPRELLMED